MKKGQKILGVVLTAAMVLSLTACGEDSSSSSVQSSRSTSTSSEISSSYSSSSSSKPTTPTNVPELPSSDFEYTYNSELGGIEITKYIGNKSVVNIPAKIDGERLPQ